MPQHQRDPTVRRSAKRGLTAAGGGPSAVAAAPSPAYNQDPRYGSPVLTDFVTNTLEGGFLDEGNPFMQQVIDRSSRDINQGFDARRAQEARASLGKGRFGSSFYQEQAAGAEKQRGQALSDAITGIRFQGYESERGRQNEMAGLAQQRDQSIWGDLTNRFGITTQADTAKAGQRASLSAANAAAGASRYGSRVAAEASRAGTRAGYLANIAGLGENARQFDAGQGIRYGDLANRTFAGQSQARLAGNDQLLRAIALQQGNQLGAAELGIRGGQAYAGANQDFTNSQIGAAGQAGQLANADLAGMQTATDYFGNLYNTEAGLSAARMAANASRFGTSSRDQLARDQMQFGSVQDQFAASDPGVGLNNYLRGLGLISGPAGGFSNTSGVSPGQTIVPGQSPISAGLQGGLGGYLTGIGLTGGSGSTAPPPPIYQ